MSVKKSALERFTRYVFPTTTTQLREDLCESIVEMALHHSSNRGADIKKLRNIAEYDLGIRLDPTIIETAVERAIEKKIVVKQGDQYYLVSRKIKEIDEILALRKRFLRDMEVEFRSELQKRYSKLTPDQEKIGIQLLYEFLSLFYLSESRLVSASIRLSPEDVEFIVTYRPPPEQLGDLLSQIQEKQFKESVGAAITSLFRNKRLSGFLHITAKNFIFFEILNLDPECRLLEKQAFSRKNLILDTNFLIALLLQTEPRHHLAYQTAILSRDIGAGLCITKRTEEELRDELEHANSRFRKLNCSKLEILEAVDDYFINSYVQEKRKNPSFSWNDFYLKMKPFRSILNRYNVASLDEGDLSLKVLSSKIFPEITGYALTCAQKITHRIKATSVAQHDAYHVLLMRELRKKQDPDILGPQYWLLTFDNSLLCVDRAVNELLGNRYEAPSSMIGWVWFELVSQYSGVSVDDATMSKAFASLMRSPLSAMPIRLSVEELLEVQNPKINFDNYSVEELQEMLGDEVVQRYIKQVRTARLEHSPRLKEYQEKLHNEIEGKSDIIIRRRIGEEILWRRVSGSFSAVALVAGILCVLLNNLSGAVVLFLVAGFLIAVAVGYRQIELGLKKLRIRIRR